MKFPALWVFGGAVLGLFFGIYLGAGKPLIPSEPGRENLNGTYYTVTQRDQVALVLRFQDAWESKSSESRGGDVILPTYIVARMDLPRCFEAKRKPGGETAIAATVCPLIFKGYNAYVQ